jgi:Flp pilus assembly protein TadD
MLEEQAFPFEDKAIALHQGNTARAAGGLWGPWIERSYAALATLLPARYGKTEQWPEAGSPAEAALLAAALAERAAGRGAQAIEALEAATAGQPLPGSATLTALGLLYREAGRLADARRSHEAALAVAPADPAALRNLAVLYDLYLDEPARALPLYQRCLALATSAATSAAGTAADDTRTYTRWVAEVQRRQPPPATAAATTPAATDPQATAAAPAPSARTP